MAGSGRQLEVLGDAVGRRDGLRLGHPVHVVEDVDGDLVEAGVHRDGGLESVRVPAGTTLRTWLEEMGVSTTVAPLYTPVIVGAVVVVVGVVGGDVAEPVPVPVGAAAGVLAGAVVGVGDAGAGAAAADGRVRLSSRAPRPRRPGSTRSPAAPSPGEHRACLRTVSETVYSFRRHPPDPDPQRPEPPTRSPEPPALGPQAQRAQASWTAATSFCRVSLASPKSMVVLGS